MVDNKSFFYKKRLKQKDQGYLVCNLALRLLILMDSDLEQASPQNIYIMFSDLEGLNYVDSLL